MTDFILSFQSIIERYLVEIHKIKKGRNEFVIFKKFYENTDSAPILDWIDKIFVTDSIKDDERSKKLRENGNKLYKEKKCNEALEAYTESICYATPDGNEITLAYANRSAVLYTIKDYENSLLDIENCFRTNYPEQLKYKVYIRQANCYLNLNRREDVIQTILKIRKCLNELQESGVEQNKIDIISKEIIEIEKSIEMPMEKVVVNEMNGNNIVQLPELKDGPNDKFLSASAAIDLRYDRQKGRHVIANRKINTGDVLFVEKPFTFVPILPEEKESVYLLPRCYNCHKLTKTSIPCNFCTLLYCTVDCKETAWDRFHRWECKGSCVDFWTRIGIGYMATRLTILGAESGYSNVSRNPEEDVNNFGDPDGNYKYISKLITNIEKVDQHTQLSNIVSAIMLALYLRYKTDFFNYLRSIPTIPSGDDDELMVLIGGILMRHLLQVVANASVIEDVSIEFIEKFDTSERIINDGYYVRATGIYPSVSMMNHSCDTNITYHFCDDYVVVKARRVIEEGDEVMNSYGYDYRKYDTEERKLNLGKQYYFECKCNACCFPTKPEMFRNGLLCQLCNGCALEDGQYFKCLECTHVFSPKNHFVYILRAEKLYKKYNETNNIDFLEKCLELRSQVFYKYNKNIVSINVTLQHYYADIGQFKRWWDTAQKCLEIDQVILGRDYLQYAVNLRTAIYNIIQHLLTLSVNRTNDFTETEMLNLIGKLSKMKTEMKELFTLFYPDNMLRFDKLDNQYFDVLAIVTEINKKNLYKYDQNEEHMQQYIDYLNSVL